MAFSNILSSYESLWKSLIEPQRQEYSYSDLGTSEFNIRNIRINRFDFTVPNKRGTTLACSLYRHTNASTILPCIIYLHGNGCSRIEVRQYLDAILSNGFNLVCFDFTGCGQSEGRYSSLGYYEQEDLEQVIQFLNRTNLAHKIVLWGRSMGAVTALLYSIDNPKPVCMILDSPFADFKRLFQEQAKQKTSMPSLLSKGAYGILRLTIKKKADFDIDALKPIKQIHKLYQVPILFGASTDDVLISSEHARDLHREYAGPKGLVMFTGEHNGRRPPIWTSEVVKFLKSHFTLITPMAQPAKQITRSSFSDPYSSHNSPSEEISITRSIKELDVSPKKMLPYRDTYASPSRSMSVSTNVSYQEVTPSPYKYGHNEHKPYVAPVNRDLNVIQDEPKINRHNNSYGLVNSNYYMYGDSHQNAGKPSAPSQYSYTSPYPTYQAETHSKLRDNYANVRHSLDLRTSYGNNMQHTLGDFRTNRTLITNYTEGNENLYCRSSRGYF